MRDSVQARDAARALDDVSDHLGEVLRNADALLAEWQRFGVTVRSQVDREARAIGDAVGGAIDAAIARGVDESARRALGDRLAALGDEIAKLEARTRAAARHAADERARDRRALWIIGGGVALANALIAIALVVLLGRSPTAAVQPPKSPAGEPPIAAPVPAPIATPLDAAIAPAAPIDTGSASEPPKPAATPPKSIAKPPRRR